MKYIALFALLLFSSVATAQSGQQFVITGGYYPQSLGLSLGVGAIGRGQDVNLGLGIEYGLSLQDSGSLPFKYGPGQPSGPIGMTFLNGGWHLGGSVLLEASNIIFGFGLGVNVQDARAFRQVEPLQYTFTTDDESHPTQLYLSAEFGYVITSRYGAFVRMNSVLGPGLGWIIRL